MKRIIIEASYVTRCPYCDKEFTYITEDTYFVESPEKFPERCLVVNCPNCGKPIFHRDRMGRNRSTEIMHC